jgi:hypothetical protein
VSHDVCQQRSDCVDDRHTIFREREAVLTEAGAKSLLAPHAIGD